MNKLILSDNDLHLLLEFEENSSLESLSKQLGKDPTVISRQLKKISELADVLTKVSGRWTLSESGKRINQSTRDFIKLQNAILVKAKHIRIGTNREFASRLVAKNIGILSELMTASSISLSAYEQGIEQALLSGEIDIGFDCGQPLSPEIKFKMVCPEDIGVVASPQFIKKHLKKEVSLDSLIETPHIYCERLNPSRIIGPSAVAKNILFSTNDIASARSGCVASLGWALLPLYSVQQEIDRGELKIVHPFSYKNERYGVWTLRSRKQLQNEFNVLVNWLKGIEST